MLVAENHSQSPDFGQLELTDYTENCVVYHGHRLQFLIPSSHVCYFELIFEHMLFSFVMHEVHVSAYVCGRT